jgi:hypothetical protein
MIRYLKICAKDICYDLIQLKILMLKYSDI